MRTFGLVSDVRLSGLATEGGGLLGAMGFFGVSFLLSLHLILVLGIGKGERTCTVDLVTQNKLWSICGRRLGGLEGKTEWFCGVRESERPMGNFRGREANIDVAGGGGLCRTNSTPWSKGRVVCCWFGGRAWTVPGRSGRSVVGPDVRCEGLLVLAFSASLGKMKSLRSLARLDCRV